MLGNNVHSKSVVKTSNSLLIKESELEDSSYEQFIDSGEEKWFEDYEKDSGGVLVLSDTLTQPTLESLLNNLTIDKPIIPNSISSSTCINIREIKRDPNIVKRNNSISWLSTAFRYEETTDKNLIIDIGSTESKPIILYASKMKLIEKLTTILGTKII